MLFLVCCELALTTHSVASCSQVFPMCRFWLLEVYNNSGQCLWDLSCEWSMSMSTRWTEWGGGQSGEVPSHRNSFHPCISCLASYRMTCRDIGLMWIIFSTYTQEHQNIPDLQKIGQKIWQSLSMNVPMLGDVFQASLTLSRIFPIPGGVPSGESKGAGLPNIIRWS